jgi:2-keto-4-pentenoate hydratase
MASADAGRILWTHWAAGTQIEGLPVECRPRNRVEGYAAQREVVRLSGQPVVGWKIAATSLAGQRHIGVDGPLAGPLLANRVLADGAAVPLAGNIMRVAESEFAFRFGSDLPSRDRPYSQQDVLAAIDTLHPAIEVPDSRYTDFVRVGAPQLIADTACASWFVLGEAATAGWRARNLIGHPVSSYRNGSLAATGSGANVLGDPLIALAWLVNELSTFGNGLRAGQFVTTGTCVVPVPIAPGDHARSDFGDLGSVEVHLT